MTIEIGSFLLLRFGNGTQVCQVIGETKTKYRVRRFNKSDALWVHTGSVIGKDDKRILGTCAVSYPGSKIPTPPSFAETVAILRQAAAECEARAKKFAERAESLPEDHPVKYERVNLRSSAKEQSRKAELHRKAAREYEKIAHLDFPTE